MAGIVDGVWSEAHSIDPEDADPIHNWVTKDGSPGPTGRGGFPAEAGRYHLYLAHGCPYCHRVSIARHLLKLEHMFSVSHVDDIKRNDGWRFSAGADPIFGAPSLHDLMVRAEGNLTAKAAAPQLIDKKSRRLVSDGSADMVRMMDQIKVGEHRDLWPSHQEKDIEELCGWISADISRGVYMVLFSNSSDDKYQRAQGVKEALSAIDAWLSKSRFLHGDAVTASDLWLFPTLLRFESIYSEIFGLDFKLAEFVNLGAYLRDLWSIEAFAATSDLKRIEDHY